MHFMDPRELGGLHVIGRNDVALGVVEGIYADLRNGYPQWAAVQSGLYGTEVSIIPLTVAEHDDRSLRIPYSVQELRDAPHRAASTAMSRKEEANLFQYYGVAHASDRAAAGKTGSAGGHTHGAGRTMLHRYAASPAKQMG
ncbi:MAG TPA: hypothetical protein VGG75_02370 [Trebonia sp.]|jgi:hypothetical protein